MSNWELRYRQAVAEVDRLRAELDAAEETIAILSDHDTMEAVWEGEDNIAAGDVRKAS